MHRFPKLFWFLYLTPVLYQAARDHWICRFLVAIIAFIHLQLPEVLAWSCRLVRNGQHQRRDAYGAKGKGKLRLSRVYSSIKLTLEHGMSHTRATSSQGPTFQDAMSTWGNVVKLSHVNFNRDGIPLLPTAQFRSPFDQAMQHVMSDLSQWPFVVKRQDLKMLPRSERSDRNEDVNPSARDSARKLKPPACGFPCPSTILPYNMAKFSLEVIHKITCPITFLIHSPGL